MKKEFFGEPVGLVLNRMMEDNMRKHKQELQSKLDAIDARYQEQVKSEQQPVVQQEKIVEKQVLYVPFYVPVYIAVPWDRNDKPSISSELASPEDN